MHPLKRVGSVPDTIQEVNAFSSPATPPSGSDPACPACGSTSLTRGRLSANEREQVEMFACDWCGDFWFERSGTRLSAEAMRSLGLIA